MTFVGNLLWFVFGGGVLAGTAWALLGLARERDPMIFGFLQNIGPWDFAIGIVVAYVLFVVIRSIR